MQELEVVKALRAGTVTLETLAAEPYNLKVQVRDNLVLLKYDQRTSDFNEPIVNECRGIILEIGAWKPVCFPFKKFYNYNELFAAPISNSFTVYEKVDGSLAKCYHYNGKWYLASNGTISASECEIDGSGWFFDAIFARALETYNLTWDEFVAPLDPNYTYMYELCTEVNRVVVKHEGFHLYYLGQRNIHTYKEEYIRDERIENVRTYTFNSIDDIVSAADKLSPSEEGYVVRDNITWNRIKIKSPLYFLASHLVAHGTPNFLRYVYEGNEGELLAYFPDFQPQIDEVKEQLEQIKLGAEASAALIDRKLERKEYAARVKEFVPSYYQMYVFKCYENPQSWDEFTKDWDYYKWERLFESIWGR